MMMVCKVAVHPYVELQDLIIGLFIFCFLTSWIYMFYVKILKNFPRHCRMPLHSGVSSRWPQGNMHQAL